ncbi:MAG: heavy-metal-associated domain-containing protein [Cyanobacteria bacterium P01_D01_bin.105]
MNTTLKVPSIKCEGCADSITKEIKVHDEKATVNVNVETKIVEVESDLSEASIHQAITAAGHEVAS